MVARAPEEAGPMTSSPMQLVLALGAWAQAHRWLMFDAMAGFFALCAVLHLVRRRRANAHTHGSARWATAREVKRAGLMQRHGVVLGRLEGRILLDDGRLSS